MTGYSILTAYPRERKEFTFNPNQSRLQSDHEWVGLPLASFLHPVVKLEISEDVVFSSEDATNFEDGAISALTNSISTGTVTDLCNDDDLPEVEILSLIEEQIPRYRLRADTITKFQGYENQDWIQTPVLPHIDDADLTPELVEETLKYFILCADRLTQMTKTYNDIEAVTRLLEEKERDLELAARIGQTLLDKNKSLEGKNEHLEELVTTANEKLNQLRHELSMKEELIKFYTQNYEGHESSPDGSSPEAACVPHLEKKIKSLEDENIQLYLETSKLKNATEGLEEKEQKLVNECVQQLDDAHEQLELFARELADKTDECMTQKQEITDLLHQIVQLQKRIRGMTAENLDLQKTLEATQDSQNYLTREIAELKEKNEELLALLEEAQDELRHLRNKERPNAVRHNYMSSMLSVPAESLASELENSLRSEVDYPRGYSPMERRKHTWKIFETVKAAKNVHNMTGSSLGVPDSLSASMLGTSGIESDDSRSVSQRSSMYFSDGESGVSEGYGGDVESLVGATGPKMGRPGIPGSTDLQRSLRRLSMRRANELNEMDFAREERERLETRTRTESELTDRSDTESAMMGRCRSPDSMLSGNSGYMSMTGSGGNPYFRMPEKLRIVKPLEGSMTLRQWQQLAKPHLGGIFESRPGVSIKGEKKLDIEAEVYTLSDYEEDDDDMIDYPTRFQDCSGVYTYTNSTVRHPSETGRAMTFTSSSQPMAAGGGDSDLNTSGTRTYSMSLGLASLLNERDLLVTPPERRPSTRGPGSNPSRFPSLVSDTHYNPAPATPTSTLTLPTNNYNLITTSTCERMQRTSADQYHHQQHNGSFLSTQGPICSPSVHLQTNRGHQNGTSVSNDPNYSHFASGLISSYTNVTDSSRSNVKVTASSSRSSTARGLTGDHEDLMSPNSLTNALGVINKLKDKGMDIYGYFYNNATGAGDSQTPTNQAAGSSFSAERPSSLPVMSSMFSTASQTSVTTPTNSPSSSGNTVVSSSASAPSDLVTAVSSSGSEASGAGNGSLYSSLFSKKTAGGVLGAIAKFRRDGAL